MSESLDKPCVLTSARGNRRCCCGEMVPRGSTKMKRYAVIAALAMGVSFRFLPTTKPPGKSQPLYSPRLADIMVATQN